MARGRLLLVRHGQSEANAERRFTSSHHIGLTEVGRREARQVAVFLRHFYAPVRLVSSPFARARQTADLISERLVLPVEVEPDVREQDLGDLHGRPYESVLRSPGFDPETRHQWRPPRGETLLEVQDRALPALLRLAAEEPASDTVVVSHGGTLSAVWAHTLGGWGGLERIPNTAILEVAHDGGGLVEAKLIVADDQERVPR